MQAQNRPLILTYQSQTNEEESAYGRFAVGKIGSRFLQITTSLKPRLVMTTKDY